LKKYLVTCDYNLEDLVIEEIKLKISEATEIKQFENFSHRVAFLVPNLDKEKNNAILQKIIALRSIHSIIELKGSFYLDNSTNWNDK